MKVQKYFFLLLLAVSCEEDVVPVPTAPSNLAAQLISGTQVNLTWTDNSTNETGFIIEEKDGKWVNYMINPHPADPRVSSIISTLDFWIADQKIIR